jgi:hypothetical protein
MRTTNQQGEFAIYWQLAKVEPAFSEEEGIAL